VYGLRRTSLNDRELQRTLQRSTGKDDQCPNDQYRSSPAGRGLTDTAELVGTPILAASSLKAVLDLDWDDPDARDQALGFVLAALNAVEGFVAAEQEQVPGVQGGGAGSHLAWDQDVEDTTARPRLRHGVVKIAGSVSRTRTCATAVKSRSLLVDGYKRHILSDLVAAVGITAANVPEAQVTNEIAGDLSAQQARLVELHIDRADLSSRLVRDRDEDLAIFCKAWRVANTTGRCPKTVFQLDFAGQRYKYI